MKLLVMHHLEVHSPNPKTSVANDAEGNLPAANAADTPYAKYLPPKRIFTTRAGYSTDCPT